MLPFLVPGDCLEVTHPKRDYVVGDLVVRGDGEEIIVHRIVRILTEDGCLVFLTKGDNSRILDIPCSVDALIGIVAAVERDGGILFLDRPWVMFLGRWLGRLSVGKGGFRGGMVGQASVTDRGGVSAPESGMKRPSIVGLLFFCIRWIHGMLIRAMFRKKK